MKIISIDIKDDCLLEITCKRAWYKSYLEEIDKLIYYLKAKDLNYKYLGWSFDENNNIVFTFRLLDGDKDIKPLYNLLKQLEYEKDKEIERLNNIINELEKELDLNLPFKVVGVRHLKNKLQELKGDGSND